LTIRDRILRRMMNLKGQNRDTTSPAAQRCARIGNTMADRILALIPIRPEILRLNGLSARQGTHGTKGPAMTNTGIMKVDAKPNVEVDPLMDAAQAELEALESEAESAMAEHDQSNPYDWLVQWYGRKHLQFNTLEQVELAALDAAKGRVKAEYRAKRKAMDWKWGEEVRKQVSDAVRAKKGKAKSVNYPFGRCGFRTTGGKDSVVVDDEDAAIAEAEAAEIEGAVRVSKRLVKSELMKHLKDGGELDGVRIQKTLKREKCYVGKHVLGGNDDEPVETDEPEEMADQPTAAQFFGDVNDAGI